MVWGSVVWREFGSFFVRSWSEILWIFGGMLLKRILSLSIVFEWNMDLNVCGVGWFYVVLDFIMYIVKFFVIVIKIEFLLYY